MYQEQKYSESETNEKEHFKIHKVKSQGHDCEQKFKHYTLSWLCT
jgi:hypothetical protein